MPVIKSAKKKMRHDKKVTARNRQKENTLKGLIKAVRIKPSKDALAQAFSSLDKAAKSNLVHKNKASRLKSRLSKLISKDSPKKAAASK